jgi:plasmid stability protein
MAAVTTWNLADEAHLALKQRAASKGTSAEAEMLAILEEAVVPQPQLSLSQALVELGRNLGGLEIDLTRDKTPAGGVDLGEREQ